MKIVVIVVIVVALTGFAIVRGTYRKLGITWWP